MDPSLVSISIGAAFGVRVASVARLFESYRNTRLIESRIERENFCGDSEFAHEYV